MVRAVIFDLGDTLFDLPAVDPRESLYRGIRRAFEDLQTRAELPPYEKYRKAVARAVERAYVWAQWTNRELDLLTLIQRVHARMGVEMTPEQAETYARRCNDPFREVFHPSEGALETLQAIHRAGYPMGLVSNTFMLGKILDEDLARAGMLEYLPVRVYSSEFGIMKPDRRIFEEALRLMDVPAAETIYVGDLLNVDIKGAKRMGMTAVLMARNGQAPSGRRRYRPDHVIYKISELRELLPRCGQ